MSVLKKMSFMACAAAGTAAELLFTLILLLPVSVLVNKQLLEEEICRILPMIAAGISVFLSEIIMARTRKKQALAMGGVLAGLYIVLASLLCVLGGTNCEFGYWLLWLSTAVLAGGVMGAAAVSGNKRKRMRYKRKHN